MIHHLEFTDHHCEQAPATALPPLPAPEYSDINILLASNSPRRRELLAMIIPTFDIASTRDIDETFPVDLPAESVPAYLSRLKSDAYADLLQPDELIITADTVVILDGKILGKPKDEAEACRMIHSLQNRTHTVVTGVTLRSLGGKKVDTFSETTQVSFGPLTDAEIDCYVNRYRPLDKAGAYGIQEWIGAAAISRIDGCFYNVMGLPLHTLYTHLNAFFKANS